MKKLTVFTPAYNRADLLPRCYESMLRQTNKDFLWMIIDDGSVDNTRELVEEWQQEQGELEIQYYYKENGGLHTAYNEAIAHIETPLCVCIDSDDFMPDDAVEKMLALWEDKGSDKYAGVVGLDYDLEGNVIGDLLPNQESVNLIDLLTGKYKIHNGDRTNMIRTELYKKFAPMVSFSGEKDCSPHYMHLQISMEYDFLVLNENLRFVEYQAEGMSNSILKQYRRSPNSFAETRKLYLSLPNTPWKFKFKHSVHLVSSCILAKKFTSAIKESSCKGITILAMPFGFLLTAYILFKTK